MKRRDFLRRAGQAGLSGSVLAACAGDDDAPADTSLRSGVPTEESSPSASGASTTAEVHSTGDVDSTGKAAEPIEVTKSPWVHLHGPNTALIRFESLDADPAQVSVAVAGTMAARDELRELETTVSEEYVDFEWPPNNALRLDLPDVPDDYAVHEVLLENLPAGERVDYEIRSHGEVIHEGHFRTAPATGTSSRVVWISDTMFPKSGDVLPRALEAGPDLVLHGGDIQYQTNPFDTWAGFFDTFGPLFGTAAVHLCIGNHEYEDQDEFDLFYRRLFEGQGDSGGTLDYHAFTWSGVRFLMLNSEVDFDEPGEQYAWAQAELEAADADPDILYSVAAFHRPFFTFSRSGPRLGTREIWHGLFLSHDVRLVLTGHNHCYERFVVNGLTYIMDGGAGALTYAIDQRIDEFTEAEIATRKSAQRSHGCTVMDIDETGRITGYRVNEHGDVHDNWIVDGPRQDDPPGTEPGGTEPGGTEPGGTEPGGTEPGGTEPGGTEPGGTEPGGTEPGGTASGAA
ncbi:MAG: hypothetical protein EA398_13910 [Deltaproteobacteria bacterium]|nr:MAG: hypothetical protein EA398_13910 [Deltaproteobacteria bacterium]